MPLVSATTLVDVTAAAFAVATLVQLTKFLIGYLVKDSNPHQNDFTRLYVYLVAACVVVLYASANSTIAFTGRVVSDILTAVLTVGTAAIAQWHLLTGLTGLPNSTPSAVAQGLPLPALSNASVPVHIVPVSTPAVADVPPQTAPAAVPVTPPTGDPNTDGAQTI